MKTILGLDKPCYDNPPSTPSRPEPFTIVAVNDVRLASALQHPLQRCD